MTCRIGSARSWSRLEADTGPRLKRGADMAEYLIYFNQQWVGDHTEEWFRGRGPLAMAVVNEMKAAGVYVFAGGWRRKSARSSALTRPAAR